MQKRLHFVSKVPGGLQAKNRLCDACTQTTAVLLPRIWCHESYNKSQEENAKIILHLSQKFLEDCKSRIESVMLAHKQLPCNFLLRKITDIR
jgi:hypothetical protein